MEHLKGCVGVRIRPKTLWRVPVFCLAASWVSYWFTVYFYGFFAARTTEVEDAAVSSEPVRGLIFTGVLFLAILLIGGLWCFRTMTKVEIAVSAAIISAVYLAITLLQLLLTGFPVSLSLTLAQFQNWPACMASLLVRMTDCFEFSVVAASFSPFLFIFFGRRQSDETNELCR